MFWLSYGSFSICVMLFIKRESFPAKTAVSDIYLSLLSAFFPLNILKYALCKAHYSLQQPLMIARVSETRDFAKLLFSSNFCHFFLSGTLKFVINET